MGRMIYWMNVSLDLFIEAEPGEDGGGDWMRIGEQLHREFNRRAAALALAVEGRRIHEIMEESWPRFADDPSMPDVMHEYAHIWMTTPKILLSNTRTEAGYDTRIVGGPDAIEQLAEMKATTDGDIGVGGATVATQLLAAGLLDELLLFQHPVVLGSGRPLFDQLDRPLSLALLEREEFEQGVVMHRYAIESA